METVKPISESPDKPVTPTFCLDPAEKTLNKQRNPMKQLGCLFIPCKSLNGMRGIKLQRGHLYLLWLVVPVVVYILLYFLNPFIQSALSIDHKNCEINFIVKIDMLLFDFLVYQRIPQIENPILDVMTALPYLLHFTLPFAYSAWLCFGVKKFGKFMQFILGFGLMCASCTILQQALPTPPPWMISTRGLPPEAGFARVDRLLGMQLFRKIYGNCPLSCGAFPSLHAAWPALILFIKSWVSPYLVVGHVLLICFAAVYSMHHYIIDVVFGIAIAWCFAKLSRHLVLNWLQPKLPTKIVPEQEQQIDEELGEVIATNNNLPIQETCESNDTKKNEITLENGNTLTETTLENENTLTEIALENGNTLNEIANSFGQLNGNVLLFKNGIYSDTTHLEDYCLDTNAVSETKDNSLSMKLQKCNNSIPIQ